MNTLIDFPCESKTCEGRCILEMQKILGPSVIAEFFEVVRDFHNDERTATKLKNMILSETSEAVKSLNERAAEMILMIDEIFLNRRLRQSSFYRLCHKLARKGLSEGSHLPDESKCVCFSEENLRKFGVDPGAMTSLKFSSNLESVKEAVKHYFGELRCADCGRYVQLCQSGNMMSCVSDCSCSSPSISSQHKVHEAILELCKAQDEEKVHDSWYLTQLKRDADYYRSRCEQSSVSSNESVNSFEVISPYNQENFEDNESVGSDFSTQGEILSDANIKLLNTPQKVKGLNNTCLMASCPAADIQKLSKSLNNKLMQSFTTNLIDASTSSQSITAKETENAKICEMKLSPAAVLRQSFCPYFDKRNNTLTRYCSTKENNTLKATVCPAEFVRCRLQELHVDLKLRAANESANLLSKEKESNPSDSLKCALNSYFKKEESENWLRK